MQKINIFLGSSVDPKEGLSDEREELYNFISAVNDNLRETKDTCVEMYLCEYTSPELYKEGSQSIHDRYIREDADATFFLFFARPVNSPEAS